MVNYSDSGLSGGAVAWQLWHRDTFDRETPVSEEISGEGLLDGLVALWRYTLAEGITENGMPSFSVFWLTWGEADDFHSEAIDVQPSGNDALLKLRRWVENEGVEDGAPDEKDPLVWKVTGLHLDVLLKDDRTHTGDAPNAASKQVLARIDAMDGPDQLE